MGSAVLLEGFGNLLGRGDRREPLDHVALLVDEELLEVPGDLGAVTVARLLSLEPLLQGRSSVAVDLDLVEHRERDIELRGDELEDLLVGSGLLGAELIARESEHGNIVVVFMKRTQTCVLRREASSARDVDDQADLVVETIERHLVARDRGHLEVVEGGHSGHHSASFGVVAAGDRVGDGTGADQRRSSRWVLVVTAGRAGR